jgi:hypothetical protein
MPITSNGFVLGLDRDTDGGIILTFNGLTYAVDLHTAVTFGYALLRMAKTRETDGRRFTVNSAGEIVGEMVRWNG